MSTTPEALNIESNKLKTKNSYPKLGPEPTLISRNEVDALYETLEAVKKALNELNVSYIITGGSLLGSIRQHSILFCDDDIDLAIIETDVSNDTIYKKVKTELPKLLGNKYKHTIRPWEGGDKVRPVRASNVFLDVFTLRRFNSLDEMKDLLGRKKNGGNQSMEYVDNIVNEIVNAACSQGEVKDDMCPFWHFNTRKAIELWPREVYRQCELFPLKNDLKMGPITNILGPRMPVWLLKRAFGDDCFECYYQSFSHGGFAATANKKRIKEESNKSHGQLPPLVSDGGQWKESRKQALKDEHYLPMQPLSRIKRRHTLHNRDALCNYLKMQSDLEKTLLSEEGKLVVDADVSQRRPRRTIYMDGVFDLFHYGHLEAIKQCAKLGDRVIIGVTGDDDAAGYKRRPIMLQKDRSNIIRSLKVVDHVVCPCPLIVDTPFMEQFSIDLVVHGYANRNDAEKQRHFFSIAIELGKFQEIPYYDKLSTTDIIHQIQAMANSSIEDDSKSNGIIKSKWFGAQLAAANCQSYIPYDPFPLNLREVIEPSIQKMRKKRDDALNAVREATGHILYDNTLNQFQSLGLEGYFQYDTNIFPLREALLHSCKEPINFDLSNLHDNNKNDTTTKFMLFRTLTSNYQHFQQTYDNFVRSICIPYVENSITKKNHNCHNVYYYQAFPCIRIIQPNDFSIGPHADSAYGHHPCSINMYVPLTKIGNTASLFLESRPGAEDWRPIEGKYGSVKHFAGAMCAHWTPENHEDYTRVSLDFRIIPDAAADNNNHNDMYYSSIKCGGSKPGGVKDVYRVSDGYYSKAIRTTSCNGSNIVWERDGPLLKPDRRVGFPWTKKWSS